MISNKGFIEGLDSFTDKFGIRIRQSIDRNLDLFFTNKGDCGEYLGSLVSDKLGTGSGGSGFDLSDGSLADEVKFACLIQPSRCNECGSKVLFFEKECRRCNSTDLKPLNDSRWSIDTDAGIKYHEEMDNYILQLLEPKEYTSSCRTFIYKYYIVDAHNKYFLNYLQNQYNGGSKKTANFIPYSFDFYMSEPIKLIEIEIEVGEEGNEYNTIFWDLENTTVEEMPTSILRKKELHTLLDNIDISYRKSDKLDTLTELVDNNYSGDIRGLL